MRAIGARRFDIRGNPLLRALARTSAALAGTAIALAALAVPASADGYVPDGCAGSVAYVCTGDAQPSQYPQPFREITLTLTAPGQQVYPGTTIGGQQIGGVVIPLPALATPLVDRNLGGGYVSPYNTGVVTPVQVCAFVTCIAQGTPVVVPGITFPVVPVYVPSQPIAPSQTVTVPTLLTVPTESVPAISTPAVQEEIVTVVVYVQRGDLWTAAYNMCRSGGGWATGHVDPISGEHRWTCGGGVLDAPSDALFAVYYAWPE